jgi:hypothetical protein
METWRDIKRKRKTEAQAIFLDLFIGCSSCKRIFVVCPFVDEETDGSYPFTNELNGLNGLAHLWLPEKVLACFHGYIGHGNDISYVVEHEASSL